MLLKKSDIWRIVGKTFGNTKAAGVKEIRLRAVHSFFGLSKRNILEITNDEAKYRKLNATFLSKALPRPVRFKMSSHSSKLIFSKQLTEYKY